MNSAHRPRFARRDPSLAQLQRDAALTRIGRTRRGLIVGAAALTAGFAGLVSAVVPGRSFGARARVSTESTAAGTVRAAPSTHTSADRMPPAASASELGLQSPDQAPQSAPSQSSQSDPGTSQQSAAPSQPAPSQAAPQSQAAPTPAAPAPAVVSGGS